MEDARKIAEESQITPEGFVPPTFEFDGYLFECAYGNDSLTRCLVLAYQARRGDKSAESLLLSYGVTIKTSSGALYWPPEMVQ